VIFTVKSVEERLLGKWVSDHSAEGEEYTTLEFSADGRLEYTIHLPDRDQIIFLTYGVAGDALITDQPSHPRQEQTCFVLTEDDRLVLSYGGQETSYNRVPRDLEDDAERG
jgi:hypothetical protein